ncbi:hypothetical protein E2C01_028650 [Portunus trituberculatus]|uniref:Uncharacterized protein n=1 Tax=Portunus trituberculatus TaxID=210409 RepID=A0A5B7EM31_PORTR|nr:hypothetical protein [Portunus trituberculatus]
MLLIQTLAALFDLHIWIRTTRPPKPTRSHYATMDPLLIFEIIITSHVPGFHFSKWPSMHHALLETLR